MLSDYIAIHKLLKSVFGDAEVSSKFDVSFSFSF